MSGSESEDENVIRYGTPLDPYEEDEVPSKRKYQGNTDQYALDDHGRRRFHGAFTGGFSAGFGNTVGTPEGWTPSTFKSSRNEKAQRISQRPEDFMDEEDRSEFGIAPRHLQTQSEFSGRKRQRQQQFHDGPIPGVPVLEQLVRAVHETAAVRMLRAMGWREGQGTGARLTRREKRRSKQQHKVYGCYAPPEIRQNNKPDSGEEEEDSTDSEFEYESLFAPEDYEPYILQRKDDRFGLGYSGLSRHSVLGNLTGEYGQEAGTSRSHLLMKDKGKKVSIRGQAFGVGALEADDDDIYATEDMSHYDYALGGAGAGDDKRKKPANRENNVLEGFARASMPLPPVPAHPPPALPRDYAPGARRSRFEPDATAPTPAPRDQGLGRHELTAEARGAMLGETPVPKATEQTDTPTKTADPIEKLVGRNVCFTTATIDDKEKSKELDFISIKDSGKELKNVFKPFVNNPPKQARYEKFLVDRDSLAAAWDGSTDKLSQWERERELSEFEQAAKLYRPLSGAMGDRFTHASQPDEGALDPLCAVAKSSTNCGLATAEQVRAAALGAYGAATRAHTPWRPCALVCKRFNVPEPGGARLEPEKEDKPKVSYSIFSYLESSVHDRDSFAKEQSQFSGSKSITREALPTTRQNNISNSNKRNDLTDTGNESATNENNTGCNKRMTVAELFLKESEKALQSKDKVEVTETIEKFDKMDLYKSIFLSDSEDEVPTDINTKTAGVSDFIDTPRNVERNLSPPRGIFADIDFDELNSWKRNSDSKKADDSSNINNGSGSTIQKESNTAKTEDTKKNDVSDDVYGPKIPENLAKRLENPTSGLTEQDRNFKPVFRKKSERESTTEVVSSSSSDSWVEAKEVSKVKKKKNKKHKSKHKKTKRKKKSK